MIAWCVLLGALFSAEPTPASSKQQRIWLVGACAALVAAVVWCKPVRAVDVRAQLYGERATLSESERAGFLRRLSEALRQYPGDPYLIMFGAHAWREQDPSRALRFTNWALQRDPNHGPAHLFAAELLWAHGARSQALLELRLAATSWPSLRADVARRAQAWTGAMPPQEPAALPLQQRDE
jgi:hypothetical protein